MIKQPDEKTREAILRIRNVPEFVEVLGWLRNLALFNHHALPALSGDELPRRQGMVLALDQLYKHLAGREVFDAAP